MMSPESVYFAEQEFSRFEEIMNTKTYLTKEEYDFCKVFFNKFFHNFYF